MNTLLRRVVACVWISRKRNHSGHVALGHRLPPIRPLKLVIAGLLFRTLNIAGEEKIWIVKTVASWKITKRLGLLLEKTTCFSPAGCRQMTRGMPDELVPEAQESVMELILKRFP